MTKRIPEEWLVLFNEHKQSGQSAAAFCRERGLCSKHFSKRRKQLLKPGSDKTHRAFVPVTVARDAVRFELQLGDALRLNLPASVSPAWLAELIQHLRA